MIRSRVRSASIGPLQTGTIRVDLNAASVWGGFRLKSRISERNPTTIIRILHLAPERHRADVQRLGRLLPVSVELFKGLSNQALFVFLQVERVDGADAGQALRDFGRELAYGDVVPLARMTARSIACSSSRTLPGQA